MVKPVFLAADPAAGAQLVHFLVLLGPIVLVWYFLVIRPQTRNRQKVQQMLASLKTGDRVVTSGGVFGTIAGFRDNVVQLQIAPTVKIDVSRSAITGIQPEPGASSKSSEEDGKGKK